jgi:hypothetical protein
MCFHLDIPMKSYTTEDLEWYLEDFRKMADDATFGYYYTSKIGPIEEELKRRANAGEMANDD